MRGDVMNWVIWYLVFIVLTAVYTQRRKQMQQHKSTMKKESGKQRSIGNE